MEDELDYDDVLSNDSFDDSFCFSEPDENPKCISLDISNGSTINKDNFTVLHYNINSILAEGRLEELGLVCSTLNVAVLICTESKLSQTIPNNLLQINGYHEPIRHDRNRFGGGCIIYISNSLTFKHQIQLQSNKFEHLWVDVRTKDKLYAINALYRPPIENPESHSEFMEETEIILARLSTYNADNKVIASDLNFGNTYCKFPILAPKPLDNSAPDLFSGFGFTQLIDIPTRVTADTISLIDLIFTFNTDNIQSFGTLPRIADHEGVFVSFHCHRNKTKNVSRIIHDFKNADEEGLIKFLKTFDFQSAVFSKPIINQAEAFSNILSEAVAKFVPTKEIIIKPTDQPWTNSYTKLLIRKKNRNYQLFKKSNNKYLNAISKPNVPQEIVTRLKNKKNKDHQKCKSADRESFQANRRAKQAFYNSVNSTMRNYEISAKKKFSILTKLMKNEKFSFIPPIIENNEVINDAQTKSNLFNDLFASKATVPGNNDPVPLLPPRNDIFSNLSNINTSPIEVAKFIRTLKKSNSSHCGIPGKFLAMISTPISFPLYRLFNNCFSIGHFPEIFKIAQITALYKRSGLKSCKLQYRPIALLPTLSKLMESIIHQRLLDHFIKNKIISDRQAAYLKGDSTIQQLLFIIHLIRKSWTQGKISQGVFLDVSAAFDKCWHAGLLAKLAQVKVEDSCHDLFRSYLANRKQFVVVEGCKSDLRDVQAGVPQGSRLGPLLWILYINDITENLESEVMLFADDTCLFSTGLDPTETTSIINRDLQKISDWAVKWKVTFNPGKTKDVIFSQKYLFNSLPIVFNHVFVDRVTEHRHLGVWLSSSLDFKKQVKEVCQKANFKLSILRSVKYLKRQTLDLLYKLTVRSVIDYGFITYYHSLNQTEIIRLNQIQYRAAKLCTGALHFSNQSKLEADLGWETLETRAKFLGLCQFQKFHLKLTRPLILSIMPSFNTNRKTRNTEIYQNFPKKSHKFSNSFFPYFTKLFNTLSIDIQSENDMISFKEKLKLKLKPKKHKHFSWGSKRGNALQTQLRVGRSFLNAHSFSINLADSDLCLCSRSETTTHYLTQCFLYTEERRLLFNSIEQLIPKFSTFSNKKQSEILLNGINLNADETDVRNSKIVYLVQNFIFKTKRFS